MPIVKTTVREADQSIRKTEPFDAGNLRGYWGNVNTTWAWCPEWVKDLISEGPADAKFVVFSYSTPIGWLDAGRGVWVIPLVKYSNTTSRHQSQLRYGADLSGYPVEYPYTTPGGKFKTADKWR